jgi:hypothetical protein
MVDHADTLRTLAGGYLWMAGMTDDREERRRFLEYAGAYAELVKQIEWREQERASTQRNFHRRREPPETGPRRECEPVSGGARCQR